MVYRHGPDANNTRGANFANGSKIRVLRLIRDIRVQSVLVLEKAMLLSFRPLYLSSFFDYPLIDATNSFFHPAVDRFQIDVLHPQTPGRE